MVLGWEVRGQQHGEGRVQFPLTLIGYDFHRYDCYNYWKHDLIYECVLILFITPFKFRGE